MQVSKINFSNVNPNFKSRQPEYENPISRRAERNLAIWSSLGGSAVAGVVVGGLTTTLLPLAEGEKRTLKNSKWAIATGAAAMLISLAFSLPSKIYNTKVNAFVKQKEMEVFSRDRDLKSNLTEQVNEEVKKDDVSLDKKLDDNLKLQMANKGNALGIANIASQS